MCYARIFYIVRKTALKTHENKKMNGSIRMHPHMAIKNKNTTNQLPHRESAMNLKSNANDVVKCHRPSIEIEDCDGIVLDGKEQKFDELKFIDTASVCCEVPNLSHHQNVQVSIENVNLQSPTSLSPTIGIVAESSSHIPTTIASLENEEEQLNSINGKCVSNTMMKTHVPTVVTHDMGVDSAVEESTVSLEQVDNDASYDIKLRPIHE